LTDNVKRFITIGIQVEQLLLSTQFSWREKYLALMSNDFQMQVRATGISFNYFNPNMSDEHDAKAYGNALVDKASELLALVKKQEAEAKAKEEANIDVHGHQ